MLALAQATEFRNNHQPLVCVSGTDRANGLTDSLGVDAVDRDFNRARLHG